MRAKKYRCNQVADRRVRLSESMHPENVLQSSKSATYLAEALMPETTDDISALSVP